MMLDTYQHDRVEKPNEAAFSTAETVLAPGGDADALTRASTGSLRRHPMSEVTS